MEAGEKIIFLVVALGKKDFLNFFSEWKMLFNDFMILLNYVGGWQSRYFLAGLLQYLSTNMALLV